MLEFRASRDERAGAFRTAELMGGEDEEIRAERRDGDARPSRQLNAVADDEAARGMDQRRRLGDRLDHAGLVVGALQGEHRRAPVRRAR